MPDKPDSFDVVIAIVSYLAFAISFKVNELFNSWVLFGAGVSMVFLPAGVKLLCILVGRLPAILGIFLASVLLAYDAWDSVTTLHTLEFVLFTIPSVGSYMLAVYVIAPMLRIQGDLANLKYIHIVFLSLTASIVNGFVHNLFYIALGITQPDEYWAKSMAMVVGDFTGCFLVVAIAHFLIIMYKNYFRK